jgi:hypothetical protein
MQIEIEVWGFGGNRIGCASSFAEAKRMHLSSIPDDLKHAYAGVSVQGTPLYFKEDLTPELLAKYPALKRPTDD